LVGSRTAISLIVLGARRGEAFTGEWVPAVEDGAEVLRLDGAL
jgi:hypothetical protein